MADLLTSVVGLAGAIAGSALTAAIGFRSERRKDHALEQQQIRQEEAQERSRLREMRVEHQQWRRERRQGAYQTFLEAVYKAWSTSADYHHWAFHETFDGARTEVARGEAQVAINATEEVLNVVLLEGPEPVATRGLALLGVARQYLGIATELSQRRGAVTGDGADIDGFRQRVEALMPAYGEAANTFIREARQALDELLVVD